MSEKKIELRLPKWFKTVNIMVAVFAVTMLGLSIFSSTLFGFALPRVIPLLLIFLIVVLGFVLTHGSLYLVKETSPRGFAGFYNWYYRSMYQVPLDSGSASGSLPYINTNTFAVSVTVFYALLVTAIILLFVLNSAKVL